MTGMEAWSIVAPLLSPYLSMETYKGEPTLLMDVWVMLFGALKEYDDQYGDEIDDIEDAPTVMGWIPCSERLPEYGQAVLVSLDGGSMTDGVRSADHAGRSVWDCALDNRTWYGDENIVIAWMPLPEAFKEGEK